MTPKMSMLKLGMLPFLNLQIGLSGGPRVEESVLDNPGGPSLIPWVLESREFFLAVPKMSLDDREESGEMRCC